MKIVFRAVALMAGGLLLVGLIGLVLLNQVLAAWPTCTTPTSAEDLAMWRTTLAGTPGYAHSSNARPAGCAPTTASDSSAARRVPTAATPATQNAAASASPAHPDAGWP